MQEGGAKALMVVGEWRRIDQALDARIVDTYLHSAC